MFGLSKKKKTPLYCIYAFIAAATGFLLIGVYYNFTIHVKGQIQKPISVESALIEKASNASRSFSHFPETLPTNIIETPTVSEKTSAMISSALIKDGDLFFCEIKVHEFAELLELTKNKENSGLTCVLLYRGVEILLGRLSVDSLTKGSKMRIPIDSQWSYLLRMDASYAEFIRKLKESQELDQTIVNRLLPAASEVAMKIKTPGNSNVDQRTLLNLFLHGAHELEKAMPHVEIGSAWGFSGVLTAKFADLLQFPNQSKVVFMISPALEMNLNVSQPGGSGVKHDFNATFASVVAHAGLQNRVEWQFSTNNEAQWRYGPVRSIFEDTNHDFASTSQSILLIDRWLIEGGIVGFHDMDCRVKWQGLHWAVELMARSGKWKGIVYDTPQKPECRCSMSEHVENCQHIRVFQKRVSQPPLGLRIIVEGNPKNTSFFAGDTEVAINELRSFTFYQPFFEA